MSRFTLEGVARGVARDDLYGFYIEFRGDDTEILRSVGVDPGIRSRRVRKEGDILWVDQEILQGKRALPYHQKITLHPTDYTYDVASEIPGMMRDVRHYVFEPIPEGSRVRAQCRLEPLSGGLRFLDAIGVFKSMVRKKSMEVMDGYCRAAESEFVGSNPG